MKTVVSILQLATLATAFVVPDEQVFAQIQLESEVESKSIWDKLPSVGDVVDRVKAPLHSAPKSYDSPLDEALSHFKADDELESVFDFQAWLDDGLKEHGRLGAEWQDWIMGQPDAELPPPSHGHPDGPPHHHHGPPPPHHGPPPPHHGPPPPHHGPPHGSPPHHRPGQNPGEKPHHRRGWRPHHHHIKVNLTTYQLISKSNHTTRLAKLIDDDKDLVKLLNGTKANYTLFAPADFAFKKIPKDFKPPKEFVKKVLEYHVAPGIHPTFKLLWDHTTPSVLEVDALGGNAQRILAKWFGPFSGIKLNYYSKIIVSNIQTLNGVVHAVSHILVPPPPALSIISQLPGTFSTFELGLAKTGLIDALNSTSSVGLTIFAPTNFAFKRLGPRINAFLFSKYGAKYLKALLEYHFSPNNTLYSTSYEPPKGKGAAALKELFDAETSDVHSGCTRHHEVKKAGWFDRFLPHRPSKEVSGGHHHPPSFRHVHIDLPTALENHSLPIDIFRHGPFVNLRVNGYVPVVVADGLANDGVIHVVPKVLIPPHGEKLSAGVAKDELTLEEFKERLEPFVQQGVDYDEIPVDQDKKYEF